MKNINCWRCSKTLKKTPSKGRTRKKCTKAINNQCWIAQVKEHHEKNLLISRKLIKNKTFQWTPTFVHINNLQLVKIFKKVGKIHPSVPLRKHALSTLQNTKEQSINKWCKNVMKEYLSMKIRSLASNDGWGKEREWEEGV